MFTALWIMLTLQVAMGAFDTLFHHELTERLPWRDSQRAELKLHAYRNFIYAVIFTGLATAEPGGWLAYGVIGLLIAELLITLRDFVEEDMTRKLPVSERLIHTVITANYGAVLALFIPLLWAWGTRVTGLTPVWHGIWSYLCLFAAFSVIVLGIRDWMAAARLGRLKDRDARTLTPRPKARKTILITGGTGFIGQRLVETLQAAGHNVIVLTRNARRNPLAAPITLIESLEYIDPDAKIDAVINLAGEPIADKLWTAKQKGLMRDSRLEMTRSVIALLGRLELPPGVLINASAIGIYGTQQNTPITENDDIQIDGSFAQKLCLDWESETRKAEMIVPRVIRLRIGMVLDRHGGTLSRMLVPTEFGGGAVLGTGQQWMSWISRDDIVRLIVHCLEEPEINGIVNAAAPAPVTNKRFTQALSYALYRPALVRIPVFALRLLGGLGKEILMGSQKVLPQKATRTGFEFLDPEIGPALNRMLGREPASPRVKGLQIPLRLQKQVT